MALANVLTLPVWDAYSDGAEGSRTFDLLVANQITPIAESSRHRNHAVRRVRCVHDVQAVTP